MFLMTVCYNTIAHFLPYLASQKKSLSTGIFGNLTFLSSGVKRRSLPLTWAQKKELILTALNTESC